MIEVLTIGSLRDNGTHTGNSKYSVAAFESLSQAVGVVEISFRDRFNSKTLQLYNRARQRDQHQTAKVLLM